ncbi:MAG: GHKL domain-containing protein, partial [Spirochaetales bacterium]|nr:GHKL domain-containing protein [Spirochaetales bacterium]
QFKDFAKMPSPVREDIELKNLITDVSSLYSESYPDISLNFEGLEDIRLKGDKGQIQRVFSNLISNSFEAIKGAGTVTVRTETVRKGNTHYCRIQITDTGTGVDPDLKKQIFDPYFTTREGGTGLGLPIVERIISDHKGVIWYESELTVGTTFYLELPMEAFE